MVNTANGTAVAPGDYTAVVGQLVTWADGDAADKTVVITIAPDTLDELDETFTATISAPTGGAQLGTITTNTVTITDDDPTPTVQFTSTSNSAAESVATRTLTITLSAASGQTVTVPYTVGGTAANPADYTIAPVSPITFNPGETTKTITLTVAEDTLDEADETAIVTLGMPTNATLGANAVFTETVTDNDPAPTAPPAPVFTGAMVAGNFLVLTGSAGTQVFPVAPGSFVIFSDLTGDGQGDVLLVQPALVVVLDGQTGRFLALATDVNGDGFQDVQVFNPNGTTTYTDGRTGIVVTF
jgi:hypothetical protein